MISWSWEPILRDRVRISFAAGMEIWMRFVRGLLRFLFLPRIHALERKGRSFDCGEVRETWVLGISAVGPHWSQFVANDWRLPGAVCGG